MASIQDLQLPGTNPSERLAQQLRALREEIEELRTRIAKLEQS